MENPTPDVIAPEPDKSSGQIERDMIQTRESITEKVAALENQVLGTIQTATTTVTDTVDAVKEAVSAAPSAVSDTVQQTLAAVKQSFHDTVGSLSLGGFVRGNPWAALGTSALAGFLTGFGLSRRHRSEPRSQPPAISAPQPQFAARSAEPGVFDGMFDMLGKEVRQIAEQTMSTVLASVKKSISTRVPDVVDSAVNRVSDRLQGMTESNHHVATMANGK